MQHEKRLTRIIIPAAMLTIALAACNLPSQDNLPQPIRDVGVGATVTPTPSPTATPTPLPTPIPTPIPIEVVHQGERDLRNGNWEAALQAFQLVLNNTGATPDERAESQLGLAHAALKLGEFEQARDVLDQFLSSYPEHEDVPVALFLRGDAKLGLSDWEGAIADFQSYLEMRPGLIDSNVYERIADAQLALGRVDQALATYDQALAADRPLVSELALRERVAQINRSLGNVSGAVAQYRAILEQSENSRYRASIEFSLGQTWFDAGEYDAAYRQFEHVFMTYPESFEALSALRALLEADYEVDQYQRGVVNFNQGQYDIAVQAFLSHLAGLDNIRDDTPLTHLYIATAYRRLGNIQAAQAELQGLLNRFSASDGEAWADAWLELADTYAEVGQIEQAYQTYEDFVADYPTLPQAPDALYEAGKLAETNDNHELAASYFERLAAEYPDDTRAAQGLFEIGLRQYQAGDYSSAQSSFAESASMPASERPAAAHLWYAKALQATGQSDAANEAYSRAVSAEPAGYYGLRAADILAGRDPFTTTSNPTFTMGPDTDEGRAEAEQWLIDTFALNTTAPLAEEVRGDIAGEPRMVRARELWALGLVTEARSDFDAVRLAYRDDPLAMYQLAIYFREIGLYRASILSAARLHVLSDIPPLDGPRFLARLRYPTYFSDLILDYSERYGLDPLFVFALIEQESLFEGFALSSASAQGLMQIWPPTGEDIADQLDWPNYRTSDLQRPLVSVTFGTWLLNDEFARFDGNPYAVLAAYNAGSGRALNWQRQANGDPDMFVEVIDLAEPKLYIQLIYVHYDRYRALYTPQ